MRQSTMIALTVLASLSLIMLGRGITGLVTSETCCSGPSCAPGFVCDEYQSPAQIDRSESWFVAGVLVLFVSFALFIAVELTHRRH